jgi:secreted Zn-dependent insulinase-like peptidase
MTIAFCQFLSVWKAKKKWFEIEYNYEKIPTDVLAKYDQTFKKPLSRLHLPQKNNFIPRSLEAVFVEEEPAAEPRLILNDQGVRLGTREVSTSQDTKTSTRTIEAN